MFDYEAAKKDGYSDADIQKATGVNIDKIRADGYGDTEIASAFKSFKPAQPKEEGFFSNIASKVDEFAKDPIGNIIGKREEPKPIVQKQEPKQQVRKTPITYASKGIDFSGVDLTKKPIVSLPDRQPQIDTKTSIPIPQSKVLTPREKIEAQDQPLQDTTLDFIPGIGLIPRGMKELQYFGDAVKSGIISEKIAQRHAPLLQAVESGEVPPHVAESVIKSDPEVIQATQNKSFTDIVNETINQPQKPPIENLIDKHLEDMGHEPYFGTTPKEVGIDDYMPKSIEEVKPIEPMAQNVAEEQPMFSKGEDIDHHLKYRSDVAKLEKEHGDINNLDYDMMDISNREKTRLQRTNFTLKELKDDPINAKETVPNLEDVLAHKTYKDELLKYSDAKPQINYQKGTVKIYRSSPKEIETGDWIGLNKQYASGHGRTPEHKLFMKEVPLKDIRWQGADFNEWIYMPQQIVDKELAPMMSKAPTENATTTLKANDVAKKFLGKQYDKLKGDINIVQSYKDLPQDLRSRSVPFSSDNKVRGVFDPKDGKVHLVADTMNEKEVPSILAHELLHKAKSSGVKPLGEAHDTFVLRLKQMKDAPLVKEAYKAAKSAGTEAKHMDEEMMAYLVQAYQHGKSMSPKLVRFVKDIIEKVKVFAQETAVKLGVDPKWLISKMNEKDIAALLKSSAIKQGEKVTAKGDILFSKAWGEIKKFGKSEKGNSVEIYEPYKNSFTAILKNKNGVTVSKLNYEVKENKIVPLMAYTEPKFRRKGFASELYKSLSTIEEKPISKTVFERTEDGESFRKSFDETNPNILFSKTPIQKKETTQSKISSAMDKVTETLQDYWKPVEKYLESSDLGKQVNDARKAIYGRTGERINEVRDTQQSIVNEITKYSNHSKESVESLRKDLNSFLIAQHAPERNLALQDKAAGITTEQAEKSLQTLKESDPTKYKILEAWANKVRKLNEQTLDILLDGQVITKELYDTLRSKYKMHVPLQRIMPEETEAIGGITGGQGFSVKSTGIKAAKGSELEVSDILGNVSANVQEAIIRTEKNRVGLKMWDMFKASPELGEARGLKMVGKDLKDMPIMETPSENMIVLFKDGKKKVIIPNDPMIAQVYNQLNIEDKGLVANTIGPVTRTIAGLYTRLNPEFAFSNVVRDIQEAFVYNVATMGSKDAIGAIGNQATSMKAVTDFMRGVDNEGTRLYKQMKMDGGTTGGVTLATRTKITKDVDDMFKIAQSNPRKAFEKVFESIDNFNSVFEDGTRLAAYKQALDKGLSRDRAATIAKETTIDFNRKGTATGWVNALYMFSNASVQGSYKMLRAFKNPKILAGTVGTIAVISAMVDSHNDAVDPDWRDKVNDFERTSNYVILLDSKDGNLRRIDIPIGWGFKPIKTMVESIRDVAVGKSVGNPVTRVLSAIASGYNPIGGSDWVAQATPTIFDVALDINRNKNWKGEMISPKGMDLANPSEHYFPSTPESLGGRLSIKLVEGTEKIGLDLTPEDIKYITSSYGGGPLNFSTGLYNMIESASSGKDIKPTDMIMARRFYKVTDPERLAGYEGKQSIKKMIEKVQEGATYKDRIEIIKTELPKIDEKDRKKAINALKFGGLLPSKKSVVKNREKEKWEDNVLNPFQSTLSTKK